MFLCVVHPTYNGDTRVMRDEANCVMADKRIAQNCKLKDSMSIFYGNV